MNDINKLNREEKISDIILAFGLCFVIGCSLAALALAYFDVLTQ